MEPIQKLIEDYITADIAKTAVGAGLILVVGLGLGLLLKRRLAIKNLKPHHNALLSRLASYVVYVVTLVWFLRHVGFDIGVLLGAAGVLTVAIGFASQTSASNLISGLFLMGEQPFVVGDIVRVDGTTGEVLSIDLMSVRLRSFDNIQIRIPNETMLKSNVATLTKFPIRRIDMQIGVAYKEDLDRVRDICLDVADRNPVCLIEPRPLFIFKGYGDSSLNFQFSVWATRETYLELLTSIHLDIKRRFDEEGIEIPFPHRTLYAGSVTEPFPVQVVQSVGHPST